MSEARHISTNGKPRVSSRLAEIDRLHLKSQAADDIFRKFTQQARTQFKMPVGLVSLVIEDGQVFRGMSGMEEWLKDISLGKPPMLRFCSIMPDSTEPFTISKTNRSQIDQTAQFALSEPVSTFVAVPMITSRGYNLGNFCLFGHQTKQYQPSELNYLKLFAGMALDEIENRLHDNRSD